MVARFCVFMMLLEQILLLIPIPVEAKTNEEDYKTREECKTPYELAYAEGDYTLTNVSCHETYQEAKTAMNEATDEKSSQLVILERKDNVTKMVDAKYALLDLNKGNNSQNTNLLNSGDSSDSTVYTYFNGNSSYGGVDAPFLDINIENKRVKMKIAGFTGWIKEKEAGYNNYTIVPLSWVKSSSKYIVTKDSISHYFTSDIQKTSDYKNSVTLGPKPSMLNEGTYYSYDGIYFYQDLIKLIDDEKKGTHELSVNKDTPYYNYYLYLPHHSKTTYSGNDIDTYLKSYYDEILDYHYTALYGTGYAFYNVQENQGINALMMLSVARNESGEGRSNYATSRNNLFGHAAYDSNPDSASLYASARRSIYTHATTYIGYGYAFPSNWKFYGSHLGNKLMGANVKYASDPYWGEKAASKYYAFDRANGLEDYNYYQLAIKSHEGTIYPAYEPKLDEKYRISTKTATVSEPYYNYGRNGSPVIIVDEVKGDTVLGSDIWYKIISDVNIDQNHRFVENSSNVKYNWDTNYVYVPASYYTKINDVEMKDTTSITDYEEKQYTYEAFEENGQPSYQVAKITKDKTPLYLDSLLTNPSGRTWNKDQYVVVFEKAYDGSHHLKSYQVTATNKKGFKEWIDPALVSFVKMTYGKVVLSKGTYANVRKEPKGALLNKTDEGLSNGSYVVILDQVTVDGVTWVKIDYDGTFGWVVKKDNEQEIVVSESTLQNSPPVINATDREIPIYSTFNPLEKVTASDIEDGDLTSKIKVVENLVNATKEGTYKVTYEVTDQGGLTATKTITITVKGLEEKNGLFAYQSMREVKKDTFEVAGFLGIQGMDNNQNIRHYFILQNEETLEEYRFEVTNWTTDYPYDMSSLEDDKPYDYSLGWFKGNVDLSQVKQGDYIAYVEVENGFYKARCLYQNLIYGEMPRKAEGEKNRGYLFEMNYYTKSRPLTIVIRDEGLLAKDIPPTTDKMYNLFEEIGFKDNSLVITGTSHNVGIDYHTNKTVTRKIVLENISTFKRYEQEVGSITNGRYVVDLKVSDGCDKTRAWFEGGINISSLEKGTYAIYVVTSVDGFSDFGELRDLTYRTFDEKMTLNGKTYTLRRVDSKRFRMELVVS